MTQTTVDRLAQFAHELSFDTLDAEAVRLAKRCVTDGVGVQLAGGSEAIAAALDSYFDTSPPGDVRAIGRGERRIGVEQAALWNGACGHAMDWDDTQLSSLEGRAFGLLTHPTVPVLSAALAVSDHRGLTSGGEFITAFIAGFEVECKIAEMIDPTHYVRGFHTSGTIGTFGAAVTAAKLLGLDEKQIRRAIGIAASMAAGIRVNFGSMTKPLHVGQAASNGVRAALMARSGMTANENALEGRWGFLRVAGGENSEEATVLPLIGNPLAIVSPGVSIKPYPSGVLTHPTMDALAALMQANNLLDADIATVAVHAGSNVLGPIRFGVVRDELEGKFSFNYLLALILVSGKAGREEFSEGFAVRDEIQNAQRKISTHQDADIEAQGYSRIRSRIVVRTVDGRTLEAHANEKYRGGPEWPLTDEELAGKFHDCADWMLSESRITAILDWLHTLDTQTDVRDLFEMASPLAAVGETQP